MMKQISRWSRTWEETEETTDNMEEIITMFEGKKTKKLKDIEDFFNVIKDSRAGIIRLSKEATAAVEEKQTRIGKFERKVKKKEETKKQTEEKMKPKEEKKEDMKRTDS